MATSCAPSRSTDTVSKPAARSAQARLSAVWITKCQPAESNGTRRPSPVSGRIISAAGVVSSKVPPGRSAWRSVASIGTGSAMCSMNSEAWITSAEAWSSPLASR